MHTPTFNLPGITGIINRHRKFILTITVLCGLLAAVSSLFQKKKYEATVEFIPYNSHYSDRNNVFRSDEARFIGYFADAGDIDRIIAIAKSETVRDKVLAALPEIEEAYKLDHTIRKERIKINKLYEKYFNVKRTPNQTMQISYTIQDSVLAAEVVNTILQTVEAEYKHYINSINKNIHTAISQKVLEIDSVITIFTDSLATLRDRYHIYDIVNPARANIINGTFKNNGIPGFARGLEELQHIEAIKDQMVKDRATYTSLLSEYSTGRSANEMPMVHIISPATPLLTAINPGTVLSSISAMLIGLFFTVLFVLIRTAFANKPR